MNRKECALALRMNSYQLAKIPGGKEIMENVTKKIAMLKKKGFLNSVGQEVALAKVKLLYQMCKEKGCKLISKKEGKLFNWYVDSKYSNVENTEVLIKPSSIATSEFKLKELNTKKYAKAIPMESLETLPDGFAEKGKLFSFKKHWWAKINIDPIAVIRIPVEVDGHEFYFGITRWD